MPPLTFVHYEQMFIRRGGLSKARQARTTARPRLEVLEDRTMPSGLPLNSLPLEAAASPPAVSSAPAMTSSAVSTLDLYFQMFAALQQNVSNLISQEIAQAESDIEQLVDRLEGINPNGSNSSSSGAALQSSDTSGMGRGNSSGAGSGKGAMSTANNAANQPLNNSTQQSGNGSGSGSSATTTHPIASKHGTTVLPMTSGTGTGTGTGSGFKPQVYFGSGSYSFPENGSGSGAELEVDLSAPSMKTVTVNYQTTNGSAIAGTDYTTEGGTLTFQPDQTSQYIRVPILDDGPGDDNVGSESFTASLSGPNNATLGSPSTTTVNIMEQATVGGEVWLDNDGDGSLDNGEMGFSNIPVYLDNSSGVQLMSTTTDSNGNYQFVVPSNLLPGNFEIQVGIPQNFTATYQGAGSAINTGGYTPVIPLAPGAMKNIMAGLLSMTVSTNQDDPNQRIQNQVTLRDAIKTGNNGGGPLALTKITFLQDGTISLQKALDTITRSYDIVGLGSSNLAVEGQGNANPYRIFTVNANVTSTISGLTIQDGYVNGNGGGILNSGTLTLNNDFLWLNEAAQGDGGAIYNGDGAVLNVNNTDIASNTALNFGGGIANVAKLNCTASAIYANGAQWGGGISNMSSAAVAEILPDTQIYSNSASQFGGGVYNTGGTFVMTGFSGGYIKGNDAVGGGGGIFVGSGTLTLKLGVAVHNNKATGVNPQGGGIYIDQGKVTVSGCTVYNNSATKGLGGGIYNGRGTLTLTGGDEIGPDNSTSNGGGVYCHIGSTTTFNSVTVRGNTVTGNGKGVYWQNNGQQKANVIIIKLTDPDDNGNPFQGP